MASNCFPIRCYTCGKPIGAYYLRYKNLAEQRIPLEKVLDDLHIKRYCCRQLFLTYVETPSGVTETYPEVIENPSVQPTIQTQYWTAPRFPASPDSQDQDYIGVQQRSQFSSHGYITPVAHRTYQGR